MILEVYLKEEKIMNVERLECIERIHLKNGKLLLLMSTS